MEKERKCLMLTSYVVIAWISLSVCILLYLSASINTNTTVNICRPWNICPKTSVRGGATPDYRPLCIVEKDSLEGRQNVTRKPYSFDYLLKLHNDSEDNGRFQPQHCRSPQSVAIIVPYRDRSDNLKVFLYNVLPKLKRQYIDFTIYLVEQAFGTPFNRGMIRNIGFIEAQRVRNYDCYIFNDVDTIPEDDRNIYMCGHDKNVHHLVTAIDRRNYTLPYNWIVGGIIAFTKEQFQRVNGYSNMYFVWGAEDDDLSRRITRSRMRIVRPKGNVGPITTLKHKRDPVLNERMQLYGMTVNNSHSDGLNTLKYQLLYKDYRKLYTWIYVKINQSDIINDRTLFRKVH